jgi:hypothetical protein
MISGNYTGVVTGSLVKIAHSGPRTEERYGSAGGPPSVRGTWGPFEAPM